MDYVDVEYGYYMDMEYDITYNTQLTYGIYMNIPTYTALISVYFF